MRHNLKLSKQSNFSTLNPATNIFQRPLTKGRNQLKRNAHDEYHYNISDCGRTTQEGETLWTINGDDVMCGVRYW